MTRSRVPRSSTGATTATIILEADGTRRTRAPRIDTTEGGPPMKVLIADQKLVTELLPMEEAIDTGGRPFGSAVED